MLTWQPPSTNAAQAAPDVISAATYFHSTFKDEVWLWRGRARAGHGIEPGMHSRMLGSSLAHTDAKVHEATNHLLGVAREARLDLSEGMRLPDLALLATLSITARPHP